MACAKVALGGQQTLPLGPVRRFEKPARRLQKLLDSLLDHSRTSLRRGISVIRSDVDLADACRDELEIVRAALPGHTVKLEVEGSCTGSYDASFLREVLSNLALNAAKYSTRDSPIQIKLKGDRGSVTLPVAN